MADGNVPYSLQASHNTAPETVALGGVAPGGIGAAPGLSGDAETVMHDWSRHHRVCGFLHSLYCAGLCLTRNCMHLYLLANHIRRVNLELDRSLTMLSHAVIVHVLFCGRDR